MWPAVAGPEQWLLFMKSALLFILLSYLAISCNWSNPKAQDKTAAVFHVDTVFRVDPILHKSPADTLKIEQSALLPKYTYYFNDNKGICKVENDTLKILLREGAMTSTVLNLYVTNQKVSSGAWIFDCISNTYYKPINQILTINQKQFYPGDTLVGEFHFAGLSFYKDSTIGRDTLTISGKFRLPVRPPGFTFEDLDKENNYKKFMALTQAGPDTIKEVSLWKCGLKEVPKEILLFRNLESLSLEENDLGRADFSFLGQLTKLKKLNLRECRLNEIPSSVFSLKELEEFDIYLNHITEIPNELFKLSNLKALQIGGNDLKTLSPEIARLTRLEWIEFSSTRIYKLPDEMVKLKSLKEIYPNDTMIYIPAGLKPLLAASCDYVRAK